MREHSHAATRVTSVRVGRTDLGEATVVVEDDALVLRTGNADEHGTRVRLSSIQTLAVDGETLTIEVTDGPSLVLHCDEAKALHARVLASCRALPELTRALRGFGSQRRARGSRTSRGEEQHRFFAPLLEARREAEDAATPNAVLAAFDARRLRRSLDAALHAFSNARAPENAAARRALEAELSDASEPFTAALDALDAAAVDARGAVDDVRRWRAWSGRLLATFEAADRAWVAVDSALESPTVFHGLRLDAPTDRRGA